MNVFIKVGLVMWLGWMGVCDGFLRRDGPGTITATYQCPSSKTIRSDAKVEFYTARRMPTDPWPVIDVEVPKTYAEFMCGVQNRELAANCNCGYLLKWSDPQSRQIYFRSVMFDSEVYFLDYLKRVLAYQAVPAKSRDTVYSPAETEFVLITQPGLADRLGVQLGDPVSAIVPGDSYIGSGASDFDDRVGMHN